MREFFRGWKRKVGCITLLMACLFAAGWMRSVSDADNIEFYGGKNSTIRIGSGYCSIVWIKFQDTESHNVMSFPLWETGPRSGYNFLEDSNFNWYLQWAGFGIGGWHREAIALWIIPYWSITIPLTLISAFLFLSHSRKSTSNKIVEPNSVE